MEAVSRVAAGLTDIDHRVFCPLMYAQVLIDHGFGHKDDQWWYDYDVGWLPYCDELVVLMLPGWADSEGLRIEVEVTEGLGIRMSYLEMPENGLTEVRLPCAIPLNSRFCGNDGKCQQNPIAQRRQCLIVRRQRSQGRL